MDFSIVVPTFNSAKYVGECLESIVSQKHNGNTQVIVVDNQSSDDTLKICQEYHTEIICEKDQGEPDAINKGMKRATGDIVAFLDSDDLYEPLALRSVEVFFEAHPYLNWMYGKSHFIDKDGKEIRRLITVAKEWLQQDYSYNRLCKLCFISQPSVFMKREFQALVGNYNVNYRLIFDYEYWLRAGKLSMPMYLDKYLSSMRAHNGSASVQFDMTQMKQSLELATRFNPHSKITYGVRMAVLLSTILYYRTIGKYV